MANVADDFWLGEAVRRFARSYADVIDNRTINVIDYATITQKFGRNTNMTAGTSSTIWDTGVANETYVSTNVIDRISSSDDGDVAIIRCEGHYIADGGFHFVKLDITLTGQTPVGAGTVVHDPYGSYGGALARVQRLANLSSTELAGDVYVYQAGQTVTAGVPQDLTLTHAKIRTGLNQSNKTAITVSNEEFLILTSARVGVAKAQAAYVDFALEVREQGGVFKEKTLGVGARDSGFTDMTGGVPFIVIPPNSDVRIVGTSSASSTTGIAEFDGILGALV
jgi:hypothetical protein